MSVGKAVVYLRELLDLTQGELAAKIGMNRSVLNRIEQGTRSCRDDELVKLADYFDISADYLLGRREVSNIFFTQRIPPEIINIIKSYRAAPDAIKKIVDTALEPYSKKKEDSSEQEAV